MARKNTVVLLAIAAVLLLQFADCMSAMTYDQQSMQCCGSMPCDPSNQSHDCCKGMISSQSPSVLPATHVTMQVPVTFVAGTVPLALIEQLSELPFPHCVVPQHPPPELYTLYSSFLI